MKRYFTWRRVAVPVRAVLAAAARDVAPGAVQDHPHEEGRIEVGQDVAKPQMSPQESAMATSAV